jgi:hypothetical protein
VWIDHGACLDEMEKRVISASMGNKSSVFKPETVDFLRPL